MCRMIFDFSSCLLWLIKTIQILSSKHRVVLCDFAELIFLLVLYNLTKVEDEDKWVTLIQNTKIKSHV